MMFEAIMKNAIDKRLLVKLTFMAKEKGVITRKCIPFDIGPSNKSGADKSIIYFYFYDLGSPDGNHTLGVLPINIINLEMTVEHFIPGDYVKWTPQWTYKRNW